MFSWNVFIQKKTCQIKCHITHISIYWKNMSILLITHFRNRELKLIMPQWINSRRKLYIWKTLSETNIQKRVRFTGFCAQNNGNEIRIIVVGIDDKRYCPWIIFLFIRNIWFCFIVIFGIFSFSCWPLISVKYKSIIRFKSID